VGPQPATLRSATRRLIVLDSTVLIDHLRGREAAQRVARLVNAHETLATTTINVEEIVRGLRPTEQALAEALFAGLIILPVGYREALLSGAWRRDFASRGTTLGQPDCLIAACTVTAGAKLATGNSRDFPMLGADVEEWPVGA
jgi:predicted nucleic acid-binding protein